MIRLMIVDDDQNYRYALRTILPWELHGYRIVAEVVHGKQALSTLEHTLVDIIITDISMPQMNGVELIHTVKKTYPNIAIIALSSYDDFAFVKEAMKCGARDYILKYEMQADDILRVVNEAREHIHLTSNQPSLDSLTRSGRQYLTDALFRSLLTNSEKPSYEDTQQILHLYKIHKQSPQLGILAVDMQAKAVVQPIILQPQSGDLELVFYSLIDESTLILIVTLHNIASTHKVNQLLFDFSKELHNNFQTQGNGRVSIGIGPVIFGYKEMQKGYELALLAMNQGVYCGFGRTYRFDELPLQMDSSDSKVRQRKEDILNAISASDSNRIALNCDAFWDVVMVEKPLVQRLNDALLELCIAFHTSSSEDASLSQHLSKTVIVARSVQDKRILLKQIMYDWIDKQVKESAYSPKIRQAIRYMEMHFSENLSVNHVAEQVDLSVNYFGSLFYSETGNRFTEHLNRIRVEESKKMILEGMLKNYEIAEIVGFESASYFSTIFKKITGLAIQEFKNQQ